MTITRIWRYSPRELFLRILLKPVNPGATLVRIAIILAITTAGALWLIHKGPVPVVRITTPLPEMAPFWYMLLAFPVLGMLVADWVDLVRFRGQDLATVELGCQIALIVGLSAVRLDSRIPLSGHALLIAYFLFRRLWLRNIPPPKSRLEVWLAAGALGGVAYPKLMWWDDPVTLLAGIGVAGGLAAVSGWVGRRRGGLHPSTTC